MMSNTPGSAGEPDDEVMRRALEIHRRLMREQGLDFYNDQGMAPAHPPRPQHGEDEARRARRG
jgi:hypothetical protein